LSLLQDFSPFFTAPWQHRTVLRQFVRREVLGRYRGSLLGMAWAFITPLLMLAVYTFVFSGIFKARWPGAETAGGVAFSLRLFAGLLVFNLFSEVVGRAPALVLEQPNLVKKVVFPLELLPFVTLGVALFHFLLGMSILLVGTAVLDQGMTLRLALLPVVLLPLLPLLLGLSWLLSALGVYVRDVAPVVTFAVGFLMFLSPVFYSLQSLSQSWQFWMLFNPLTSIIENVRVVLFLETDLDWASWGWTLLASVVLALVGARVFSVLRRGFADVV